MHMQAFAGCTSAANPSLTQCFCVTSSELGSLAGVLWRCWDTGQAESSGIVDSLAWTRFRRSDPLRAPVRVLADVCVKELSAKEQRNGLSDSGRPTCQVSHGKSEDSPTWKRKSAFWRIYYVRAMLLNTCRVRSTQLLLHSFTFYQKAN